jgi:hypothetical protein
VTSHDAAVKIVALNAFGIADRCVEVIARRMVEARLDELRAHVPRRRRHGQLRRRMTVFTFNEVLCGQVSKSWPMTHCCKDAGPGLLP